MPNLFFTPPSKLAAKKEKTVHTRSLSPKALGTRIRALTRQHRKIDSQIEMEQTRPNPDGALMRQLKRERLSLKDALHAAKKRARWHNSSDTSLA